MHILHTVLYAFPEVLTRRIYLQSRASLVGDHFLYFRGLILVCDLGLTLQEKYQMLKIKTIDAIRDLT